MPVGKRGRDVGAVQQQIPTRNLELSLSKSLVEEMKQRYSLELGMRTHVDPVAMGQLINRVEILGRIARSVINLDLRGLTIRKSERESGPEGEKAVDLQRTHDGLEM